MLTSIHMYHMHYTDLCLQDSLERGALNRPTTDFGHSRIYSIACKTYMGILHKSNKTIYVNFFNTFKLKMATNFACLLLMPQKYYLLLQWNSS